VQCNLFVVYVDTYEKNICFIVGVDATQGGHSLQLPYPFDLHNTAHAEVDDEESKPIKKKKKSAKKKKTDAAPAAAAPEKEKVVDFSQAILGGSSTRNSMEVSYSTTGIDDRRGLFRGTMNS